MKKVSVFLLMFSLLSISCSKKVFQMVSEGENFDALSQITELDRPVFYPNGGDYGDNLVFSLKEEDGFYNIYMKENVLGKAIVQKTSGQGINLNPAYCNANGRIVFQYFDKTNFDIYYIESGKGKAITQVTNTEDDEYVPTWSPDGNMIVFEKGAMPTTYIQTSKKGVNLDYQGIAVTKNQIWIKNLKTKELKMLGIGSRPVISPDGKNIAFIKYDLDRKKLRETGTLWIMTIDGDSQKQITNVSLGYAMNPYWSPDGKNIVFELTKRNKKDSDIYVIDTNGETLKQYTTNKSNDFGPIWSADDYIYFSSDRGAKAKRYQIWRFKIKSK